MSKFTEVDSKIAALRKQRQDLEWDDYVQNWRPKYQAMVGKCYKYQNSYSPEEKWWLYKRLNKWVEGDGCDFIVCEKFQIRTSNADWNQDVIILGGSFQQDPITEGWIEITEDEYQEARAAFFSEMMTHKQQIKHLLED